MAEYRHQHVIAPNPWRRGCMIVHLAPDLHDYSLCGLGCDWSEADELMARVPWRYCQRCGQRQQQTSKGQFA